MMPDDARAILNAMEARDECLAQARKLDRIIDTAHTRYMQNVGLYGIRRGAFCQKLERIVGEAK